MGHAAMSRIRTVKPELWTDEDFNDLSLQARLMFIASLNFADDFGVLPDKPRTLAARCLPFDEIDPQAVINELVAALFFVRREAPDGSAVLLIRTFTTHQRIDKRTKGQYGDPAEWQNGANPAQSPGNSREPALSPRIPANPVGGREGKGRDGMGMEGNGKDIRASVLVDDLTVPVDKPMREFVIEHEATKRLNDRTGPPIKNPNAWRMKVIAAIESEHGSEIDRIIAEYPPAPYDVVTSAAIHGDKHSLVHHERKAAA
jgi:hypothetical protein